MIEKIRHKVKNIVFILVIIIGITILAYLYNIVEATNSIEHAGSYTVIKKATRR